MEHSGPKKARNTKGRSELSDPRMSASLIVLTDNQGTKGFDEPGFIKEKIASVVVEIAKREWGGNWDTLPQDFHAVLSTGDERTELVLIIYRELAHDIHTFNKDIPKNRIRLLSRLLDDLVPDLLAFFYQVYIPL